SYSVSLLEKSHALQRGSVHARTEKTRLDLRHISPGEKCMKILDGSAQETGRGRIAAARQSLPGGNSPRCGEWRSGRARQRLRHYQGITWAQDQILKGPGISKIFTDNRSMYLDHLFVNTEKSAKNILSEIAQINRMERGKLSVMRETSDGTAYKLQAW